MLDNDGNDIDNIFKNNNIQLEDNPKPAIKIYFDYDSKYYGPFDLSKTRIDVSENILAVYDNDSNDLRYLSTLSNKEGTQKYFSISGLYTLDFEGLPSEDIKQITKYGDIIDVNGVDTRMYKDTFVDHLNSISLSSFNEEVSGNRYPIILTGSIARNFIIQTEEDFHDTLVNNNGYSYTNIGAREYRLNNNGSWFTVGAQAPFNKTDLFDANTVKS